MNSQLEEAAEFIDVALFELGEEDENSPTLEDRILEFVKQAKKKSKKKKLSLNKLHKIEREINNLEEDEAKDMLQRYMIEALEREE